MYYILPNRCVDPLLLYTAPNGIQQCYSECPRGTSPEANLADTIQRRICSGEFLRGRVVPFCRGVEGQVKCTIIFLVGG